MSRAFVICHRSQITGQAPQPVAVAVGQVKCDIDPLLAFDSNRLKFGLELFRHQPIEQGRVFDPTTVIALEEVMQIVPPAAT
jgi:hypothetical protein